ncbi:MAG: flagellar assembly peptidoglycan hydrolase FlgJ, partial [Gammaproteobacteria bacterium]
SGMEMYQDLFDKQVANSLAGRGGLGIAEMIERQIGGARAAAAGLQPFNPRLAAPATAVPATGDAPAPGAQDGDYVDAAGDTDAVQPLPAAAVQPARSAQQAPIAASPQEFAARLYPHARAAAASLGTQPEVLIAQAALETGWGRRMITGAGGSDSNNLFGIKADARWDGARARVPTLEYEGGVAQRRMADFRSYDDLAASFDDYVDFVKSNPRYADALAHGADPRRYIRELQDAGYATDPRYAQKVIDIMGQLRPASAASMLAAVQVDDNRG